MAAQGKKLRLQIASDIHGELRPDLMTPGRADVVDAQADLVIMAGDIAKAPGQVKMAAELFPAPTPLVMVHGNHEYYNSGLTIDESLRLTRAEIERLSTPERPIIFMENDVHIVTIDGIDIRLAGATLWTDYSLYGNPDEGRRTVFNGLNDYLAIKDLQAPYPVADDFKAIVHKTTEKLVRRFDESTAFLSRVLATPHDGPTVIVTHHLPSVRSIDMKFMGSKLNPGFASNLDYLIAMGPTLWVHGHTHTGCLWRDDGGTLVVCNPMGYRRNNDMENADFNPGLIIELKQTPSGWSAEKEPSEARFSFGR